MEKFLERIKKRAVNKENMLLLDSNYSAESSATSSLPRKFLVSLIKYIARKLDGRPLNSIYIHIISVYHPGNNLKNWTEEDNQKLVELVDQYGPKWALIGLIMERHFTLVRDVYRRMRNNVNSGHWSEEEDKRLLDAIELIKRLRKKKAEKLEKMLDPNYQYEEEKDEEMIKYGEQISNLWVFVSSMVGTRAGMPCKTRYDTLLAKATRYPNKSHPWDELDDWILVNRIYEKAWEEEDEIKWFELRDEKWSGMNQGKPKIRWNLLKKRVDDVEYKDLDTILETLMLKLKPIVDEKIKKIEEQERIKKMANERKI